MKDQCIAEATNEGDLMRAQSLEGLKQAFSSPGMDALRTQADGVEQKLDRIMQRLDDLDRKIDDVRADSCRREVKELKKQFLSMLNTTAVAVDSATLPRTG